MGTREPEPKPGEIVVPRWVILVTFVIGWVGGGAMLTVELIGQGRLGVLILAAWLITLPLVATNPLSALAELLGSLFGGRRS